MIDQSKQFKYALFIDNSGSVGNCASYWKTVQQIMIQYSNDICYYYFWNSFVFNSNRKALQQSIINKKGTGGTNPQNVAKKIVQQKHEMIILITDGQVSDHNVKECDKIFERAFQQKFHIKKAICYVIGSHSEPNLSVTCPFTRMSESKIFSRNGMNPLKTVMQFTNEDFKILDSLSNISLQNFQENFELIEQLIIAKNMGKSENPQMKNSLILLKRRLIQQYSKKLGKKEQSQEIRELLLEKKLKEALQKFQNISSQYFNVSETGQLQKKFNYLISLCGDLRGQFSVDQIKSNKMKTAAQTVQGEIAKDVNLQQLSDNIIECPIILDQDVPQILIDECQPFLLGLDKVIVDDINACPLRILNYPLLRAKLKSKLSTYTGVKYSDKFLKNPFTQKRLLGAIPLGKHKTHITVGNNTIAKLISGGKVMGNLNLYFAVIWIIINEDKIEYLQPIKNNIDEHFLYRLRQSKTMASLCGLSQYLSTQISTDIAIWYCLNSAYFNLPTEKDTFRFHLFQIQYLIKIVQFLDYPILEGIKIHYSRTLTLFYMLDKYKRIDNDQRKMFKNLFKGFYQKGFFINSSKFYEKFKKVELCSEFIPIDGAADEQQIKQVRKRLHKSCQKLPDADIYYLSTFLNEHKLFSDIFLSINLTIPDLPKAEINWKYGLQNFEHKIQINPITMRPQTIIGNQHWEEIAKSNFKIDNSAELFKGCKYIQEFIMKHKKKPTQDEIAVFYYNRYIEAGKVNTLPFQTKTWINELLSQYQTIFHQGFNIKTIIQRLKESKNIQKRKVLESTV